MTALRETALAAIAARLTAQVTTATVSRARPDPIDLSSEPPILILSATDWTADETAEPLAVHYTLGFSVTGVAKGRSHLLVEQSLSDLHASATTALSGWTPTGSGLGEPAQGDTEFRLYDTEESATPAGEFTARFTMLCLGPLIA